jgi:hypothetical protein
MAIRKTSVIKVKKKYSVRMEKVLGEGRGWKKKVYF